MHSSNAWAAFTAASNDELGDALPPGLGLRDVEALTLVDTHPGCSVEWLRHRVGLTQSGTVRLVDRLQRLDLVRRDPTTGRERALTVTRSGSKALRSWHAGREAAMQAVLGGLSGAERRQLLGLLGRALTSAPRERPQADRTCRTCEWARCGRTCPVDASVPA